MSEAATATQTATPTPPAAPNQPIGPGDTVTPGQPAQPTTPPAPVSPPAAPGTVPPMAPGEPAKPVTDTQPTPATPPAAPGATPPASPAQPPSVPEKYDLKLPEKSPLTASHVEKIEAYAKSQGLSQPEAQRILERESTAVADLKTSQLAELEKAQSSWIEIGKADPEIGGEAFKQNVELAKRFVDRFGTAALKQELNNTKYGNHPELVRMLSRAGKVMSEDQLILPSATASGEKSHAEILYSQTQDK